MTRKWTGRMDLKVRRYYPSCACLPALAEELGVTLIGLQARAKVLRVARLKADGSAPFRRPWSEAERQAVRERYGKEPASRIAEDLGRRKQDVQRVAWLMGLAKGQKRWTPAHDDELRRLNGQGYCDGDAAQALGFERHRVGVARVRLGLPSHARGERWLGKIKAAVKTQLERMGMPSAGHLRAESHRRFAEESGWPRELRPRHVQILNLMCECGMPLSRREIADGVGMPWKGSRKSLVSNDREGSYLGHLAARGLVAVLPRAAQVLGQGRGASCHLYMLGPTALAILGERAKGATG